MRISMRCTGVVGVIVKTLDRQTLESTNPRLYRPQPGSNKKKLKKKSGSKI